MEALSFVAVYADTTAATAAAPEARDPDLDAGGDSTVDTGVEEFWVAQLLDDVTCAMLEAGDTTVRITWLNKAGSGGDADGGAVQSKKQAKASRYEYAYDDSLDVAAILCHVFALECADGTLEVTKKSLERVRSLLCILCGFVVRAPTQTQTHADL